MNDEEKTKASLHKPSLGGASFVPGMFSFNGMILSEALKNRRDEVQALQAVDFVSWAIFRKYEYGDEFYYNIVKGKIIEENPLFA